MEEKNVKHSAKVSGLIVALVVALIVILGLVGYVCYDKGIILNSSQSKESKAEDRTEDIDDSSSDDEQVVDINSDLVQNLYSIFRFDKTCYMNVDSLNNNNLVKLRVAYENIPKQNLESIECSKLELSDRGYCGSMNGAMMDVYNTGDMAKFRLEEQKNYTDSISAKLIEAKVHELFGSDYQVNHESFGTGHVVEPSCYFMKYDKANNLYAQFNCEGGGTCGIGSQQLVSASKKGNELYIVTTLTDLNGAQSKATYTFKKDKINDNYVFVKVLEG